MIENHQFKDSIECTEAGLHYTTLSYTKGVVLNEGRRNMYITKEDVAALAKHYGLLKKAYTEGFNKARGNN